MEKEPSPPVDGTVNCYNSMENSMDVSLKN